MKSQIGLKRRCMAELSEGRVTMQKALVLLMGIALLVSFSSSGTATKAVSASAWELTGKGESAHALGLTTGGSFFELEVEAAPGEFEDAVVELVFVEGVGEFEEATASRETKGTRTFAAAPELPG